jgi:KDO2-lipid IV(A) lauroyltransferase
LSARLFDNQLRRGARDNLKLVYHNLAQDQRQELLAKTLYHAACALTETAFLWHRPIEQVLMLESSSQVSTPLVDGGRPAIIVAPHLGNWEFLNLWLASKRALMSLYKPARDPSLDRYIRAGRSRNGAELLPTSNRGLKRLMKGLREGKSCMILPDQKPGKGRGCTESLFFGLRVDSSTLVQQLARKTDSDIYIASALRDLPGKGFKILLQPLSGEKLRQPEPAAANYLNRSMEAMIQQAPEQYQWAYRRFRRIDYSVVESARNSRCR